MRLLRFLTIALMSLLMGADHTFAAAVSASELQQLFPGNFVAYVYGVARINLTASANGAIYGKMGKADTGVWRLNGNMLCIKFKRWLKGRNRCGTVSKDGDWFATGSITFKKVGG